MDEKPFLEIDILNVKENQVSELKKFHKSNFDLSQIFDTASELKYSNEFKNKLSAELQNPSDDFVRFFLIATYAGRLTQPTIEKFRPIIKKSLNNHISELMNDKIKSALDAEAKSAPPEEPAEEVTQTDEPKIVTTADELEAYFVVKNCLKEIAPIEDITYKDNERYMAVLYKDGVRNWVCRFYFGTKKTIAIPDENKKECRYIVESVYDIEQYAEELKEALRRYM